LQNRTPSDLDTEFNIPHQSVILVIQSSGTQSFKLRMRESGEALTRIERVTANFLGRTIMGAGSFSHPLITGRKYLPNENRFVVIESPAGKKIRLSINYLDLETGADFLVVYKFSKMRHTLIYIQK